MNDSSPQTNAGGYQDDNFVPLFSNPDAYNGPYTTDPPSSQLPPNIQAMNHHEVNTGLEKIMHRRMQYTPAYEINRVPQRDTLSVQPSTYNSPTQRLYDEPSNQYTHGFSHEPTSFSMAMPQASNMVYTVLQTRPDLMQSPHHSSATNDQLPATLPSSIQGRHSEPWAKCGACVHSHKVSYDWLCRANI